MIIRQIKQRPVQQVSVDLEGIYSQQSLTRRAAERVAGKDRFYSYCRAFAPTMSKLVRQYRYIKGIEDGRAT